MNKKITLSMLMTRLTTVRRELKESGFNDDPIITLSADGKLYELSTDNFEVDENGNLNLK